MRWLFFVMVVLLTAATTWAADDVVLKGRDWTVAVTPATLGVMGTPNGGSPLVISAGAQSPAIAELTRTDRRVGWAIPSLQLEVQMRLGDDDALEATFTATKAGEFTWPILPADGGYRGYILPMFEGLYVPGDDQVFADFLAKEGPYDTTAGLSMPFFGVDCGKHTITYLLDNAFNNALAFRAEDHRLAAGFTHTFTRNHAVKRYTVRIQLGAPSPVEPARIYRKRLMDAGQFVSFAEKIKKTPDAAKLLGAAHIYLWGDGVSTGMLQAFADAGLDRLWLGSPDWKGLGDHPDAVQKAIALGYLIGPYDSYHSIHSPVEADTWETAQFDQKLYESGAVVKADGTKKTGFKKKGYILNCTVARPWVESRVRRLMAQFRCNSWFIDCDAAGELYDDYSAEHPATQEQDMLARLARMAWIRDTFQTVIGSEGGSAYAAGTIHFAHGIMTPVIGWGDPALTTRSSPYWLGGYYPPGGPACFFKQVPMKPEYRHIYADPRFRLPLYQTVYHDSVIATHQWGYGSLKFKDEDHARELLELLYDVPPLYHLNSAAWGKEKGVITRHYQFFSPQHRVSALMAMTDFQWLTKDRRVQRTRFGDRFERVANFGDEPFTARDVAIPPHSIGIRDLRTGSKLLYKAALTENP